MRRADAVAQREGAELMTEGKKCPQVMLIQPFLSAALHPTAEEIITVEPHHSVGSGT